ncbi:hypothetical protein [Borrelia sp. RT5S]|uniref:hypothetical protein n=1 Tax=Borrelia sp. RT5S TaxID=2898581 RepID=UPI001E4AB5D8|nr:hypothetical protein [Borrelia sp. RT5S]UGQ16642.1 hypothetical protein LSO06_04825 [Borrelia sp. RT5S]
MRSLVDYFLIVSLAMQVCACRRISITEDCSTCLYNCSCNTPTTSSEDINGKELQNIRKETENFVRKIKEEVDQIKQKTEKFVQGIEKDIDHENGTNEIIVKTNCPRCIWGCNCVKKIYMRRKHKSAD